MFGKPGGDGVGEPMFSDECFADDVGICEGGLGVCHEVVEIKALVRPDLKAWIRWRGKVRKRGYQAVR